MAGLGHDLRLGHAGAGGGGGEAGAKGVAAEPRRVVAGAAKTWGATLAWRTDRLVGAEELGGVGERPLS